MGTPTEAVRLIAVEWHGDLFNAFIEQSEIQMTDEVQIRTILRQLSLEGYLQEMDAAANDGLRHFTLARHATRGGSRIVYLEASR